MRYLEAYDLIGTSLTSNNLAFPATEPLIAQFFDDHVINVALGCLRKVNTEELSPSSTNIAFTNTDIQSDKFTSQIFKVETTDDNGNKVAIPFVPESAVLSGDDTTISHLGYYFKTDISRGDIADTTAFGSASGSDNTLTVVSTAHGLDVGDYVILSDQNKKMVLVPPRYGNGHCVISDHAVFMYKWSYHGSYPDVEDQFTMSWNDPEFNVEWPVDNPILSSRDKKQYLDFYERYNKEVK